MRGPAGLVLLLAGCSLGYGGWAPALAPTLDQAQVAVLEQALASRLQRPVTVHPDVFSRSHILVLDSALAATPDGRVAGGRSGRAPATVHLLGDGRRCLLVLQGSGERIPVAIPCQPRG